jgi:membrane protein
MVSSGWSFLKEAILAFINDEAISRGAAIAFFAVTSLGPILLIVVAIAGVIFGHDAALEALTGQFHDLMGQQSA